MALHEILHFQRIISLENEPTNVGQNDPVNKSEGLEWEITKKCKNTHITQLWLEFQANLFANFYPGSSPPFVIQQWRVPVLVYIVDEEAGNNDHENGSQSVEQFVL